MYIWSLLYLSNKVRKHKKDITQATTQPSRGTSRGTGFELIVPLRSGPGTGSRSTMTRSTCQPYIAPVVGEYTEWTPLDGRESLFTENIDKADPWQFKNILVGALP